MKSIMIIAATMIASVSMSPVASAQAPATALEQIEDDAQFVLENARRARLSAQQIDRLANIMTRAASIVEGSRPGPPPRPRPNPNPNPVPQYYFSGDCTIDDDPQVDQVRIGKVYGTTQLGLTDSCKAIAQSAFGNRSYSSVRNLQQQTMIAYALSATCKIDDDPQIDQVNLSVIGFDQDDLISGCELLAKNYFGQSARTYTYPMNMSPMAQPIGMMRGNCVIDDDPQVDQKNIGDVFGRSLTELAQTCHAMAENEFGSRAHSKLGNVTAN